MIAEIDAPALLVDFSGVPTIIATGDEAHNRYEYISNCIDIEFLVNFEVLIPFSDGTYRTDHRPEARVFTAAEVAQFASKQVF